MGQIMHPTDNATAQKILDKILASISCVFSFKKRCVRSFLFENSHVLFYLVISRIVISIELFPGTFGIAGSLNRRWCIGVEDST